MSDDVDHILHTGQAVKSSAAAHAPHGHDAFLIEAAAVNELVLEFRREALAKSDQGVTSMIVIVATGPSDHFDFCGVALPTKSRFRMSAWIPLVRSTT